MKKFRELLCKLFGHRSIKIFSKVVQHGGRVNSISYITVHECERCEKQTSNQWDE